METYKQLTEHHSPKSVKTRYLFFITIGIVYMVFGVVNYYKSNEDIWMTAIWFFGGLGYIVMAFIQKNRSEKYFIEFNDNGIDAKFSAFKSINIKWNEIKDIEIKPLSIVFKLKSNLKDEELSLSAYSYGSVRKFKSKLNEIANEKGIEIK